MSESILGKYEGYASSIADSFINLSAEYPALLNAIFLIFAALGVVVAATAVLAIIKKGSRDAGQESSFGGIATQMLGGVLMVDLSFWASSLTDTLWSMSSPLDIAGYAQQGAADYWQTAFYAVIGFMVLAGYVVLGTVGWKISQLGKLSPESRSNQLGSIISRILAGSAMVASVHIAQALDDSMKINWLN